MSGGDALFWLKLGVTLAALCFGVAFARALVLGVGGPLLGAFRHYADNLDAQLRILFKPAVGTRIAASQLTIASLLLGATLLTRQSLLLLALLPVGLAPSVVLESMRRSRRERIEAKLDGFALTLANATRATPSIGRALELVQRVLPEPLDQEIELVLREMRVGSSIDQALLGMSARVRSGALDAVFSGVLIGRQVGGNLPLILETCSSTLREMSRLEGVLRSKTAEAKSQTWVLAAFPLFLVFGFNTVSPGYFDVLSQDPTGMTLMTIAIVLWVTAIFVARRILSVEL